MGDKKVIPQDLLLEEGKKYSVSPYYRKRFYNERLDDPIKNADGTTTFVIGEKKTKIPFVKEELNSNYLKDMIDQLESLKSVDGIRTIVQLFIDAGANENNISIVDPADDAEPFVSPSITFGINTKDFVGSIYIAYDLGSDTYVVKKVDSLNNTITSLTEVYFDMLGEVVYELVDQKDWFLAKVEKTGK